MMKSLTVSRITNTKTDQKNCFRKFLSEFCSFSELETAFKLGSESVFLRIHTCFLFFYYHSENECCPTANPLT